jgi:sulfur-carrier protein
MPRVTILYFAWVRELVGHEREDIELSAGVETVRDLAAHLALRGGGYADALRDPRLRAAADQTMVDLDAPIGDASEIAFFPPVTGG